MAEECILSMQDITVQFPGVLALDKVQFYANRGEVHVLLGENGAGKSTIMKVLAGVYNNYSGTVELKGKKIVCSDIEQQRQRGISMIFQEMNLLKNLTVAENIFLGRQPCKNNGQIDWKKMNRAARELLDSINSDISEKAALSGLSVGQMQMVEIAKALSFDADIIIMDEPTSALTEKEVSSLFAIINTLKARGIAIIYISHRLKEIFRIGDRITILRDGRCIKTMLARDTNIDEVTRLMVGRELSEHFPKVDVKPGEKLLEVKNLNQGNRLKDISFYARAGEITGFYGLMGAGRTELMRAIFGADRFDSGQVLVNNKQVTIKNCKSATDYGIALLTEDRKNQGLILSFPIKENISLANLDKIMNKTGIRHKFESKNTQKMIDMVNVKTPSVNQLVVNLSGGNQQKVVVAKWLNTNANIIIFDEPTRGIDVGAKVEIYKIMNDLKKQGKAIIMVSSELSECIGVSDRLYVMHEGVITACIESLEGLTEDDIIKYATGSDRNINCKSECLK